MHRDETGGPKAQSTTNALLFDGGGIRGLASLLILQQLMHRINALARERGYNSKTLHPQDVFDLVAGTSTGGLIAIMLGKLGMSVQECIDAYEELSGDIFGNPRWSGRLSAGLIHERYDGQRLRQHVCDLLTSRNMSRERTMIRLEEHPRDPIACAVVCTEHMDPKFKFSRLKDSPMLFCNATCSPQATLNCLVCDAAQATTAAMTYFEMVKIGDRWFSDGGVNFNNPSYSVIEHHDRILRAARTREDYHNHPPQDLSDPHIELWSRNIRFINIGTGHIDDKTPEPIRHKVKSTLTPKIIVRGRDLKDTLVRAATQSETSAKYFRLLARSRAGFKFERLSPTNGLAYIKLDKYKKLPDIRSYTKHWLDHDKMGPEDQKVFVRDEIERIASEIVSEGFLPHGT